jgi:RNA polymerase sigma-70 factor, ECF subfamily
MQAIGMAPVWSDRKAASVDFDSLVWRYKNQIYSYIARVVGAGPEAEDLTQDVFVRAFHSLGRYRGDAAPDTWLYRIATNIIIDRHRKRGRRGETVSLDDENETVAELPDLGRAGQPLEMVASAELQREVRAALDSLPVKLRTCVVLFDLEGLTYEEIAAAVGCPVGTVKSRIFNGRAKLRERLAAYVEGGR